MRSPFLAPIEDTLLSDESGYVEYAAVACSLVLTSEKIVVATSTSGVFLEIELASAVGAKYRNDKTAKYLDIFVYSSYESSGWCASCCNSQTRSRHVFSFKFRYTSEDICRSWERAINDILRSSSFGSPVERLTKYLVIVNPVSGTGNGEAIWKDTVEKMLTEASIEAEVLITNRKGHAADFCKTFEPFLYSALLVVGGDGIMSEVINGIAYRSDGLSVLKSLAINPIPAGSGNGLAKSILYECGEAYSVINATFIAIRGSRHSMDLSIIETKSKKLFSFLCLGWGLVSDVDIKSESLRVLGETRFHLAAVYFIGKRTTYKGRLSLLLRPLNDLSVAPIPPSATTPNGAELIESPMPHVTPSSKSSASPTVAGLEPSTTTGDKISAEAASMSGMRSPRETAMKSGNKNESQLETSGAVWKVIDSEFILVWIVQTSHASSSMYSGPGVSLDDGVFTVLVAEAKDFGRADMLQLLLSIDSGGHIKHPGVQMYKASEYKLEPLESEKDAGILTVDGEVVDYATVQATVLPMAATILRLP